MCNISKRMLRDISFRWAVSFFSENPDFSAVIIMIVIKTDVMSPTPVGNNQNDNDNVITTRPVTMSQCMLIIIYIYSLRLTHVVSRLPIYV